MTNAAPKYNEKSQNTETDNLSHHIMQEPLLIPYPLQTLSTRRSALLGGRAPRPAVTCFEISATNNNRQIQNKTNN